MLRDSGASLPAPPRLAYLAAAALAAFAFLFRLLTLRSLPNDHYMYLAWAQQLRLGELPERDFVDPGIPLQGVLSAAAQALAPGPAAEGTLTIAMLALAAAATCVGVAWLTRSTTAGALAALFQIVAQPRLYSFPKILVPAVFLVLALAHARRPRTATLALLAMWIVVAFLLRHDLGVYVGVGSVVTVALCGGGAWRAAREVLRLTTVVLLMLLPYFIYLEWSGSIVEHARASFEYGKSEVHLFQFDWPVFGFGASQADGLALWNRDDAAAFLFYCSYALPLLSLLVLLGPQHRGNAAIRAVIAGVVAVSAFYAAIILRHPLPARVPDLAAIYAVLGAWCVVGLARLGGGPGPRALAAGRWALRASLAAALAVAVLSIDVITELRVQVKEARLVRAPSEIVEDAARTIAGPEWPWRIYWPAGPVPAAIEYLYTCTTPDQRVWVTWQAPEYYFFARRGFGAGHALLPVPHSYTAPRDQALMIARLDRHEVPIVLINESIRADFAAAYPSVDEYLRRQYARAGEFTIRDGSLISIAIRRGLRVTDVYGDDRWPCRLTSSDHDLQRGDIVGYDVMGTKDGGRSAAQRIIAENRKAFHDYHVLETWEAGLVLLGSEVKAIREGRVNLRDSFARVEKGEVWLQNVHISPYSHTGYARHDERRQRKLLLHQHEIQKLTGRVVERGLTLVPLQLYLKDGRVKVQLALVKGKQMHDKRETIRRREIDRETRAAVKARQR